MKLTLNKLLKASFTLDSRNVSHENRTIIATNKDRKNVASSVSRKNTFLFNECRALSSGATNNFLGFEFVEPDSELSKGVGKRKSIIDGFTFIWEPRKK